MHYLPTNPFIVVPPLFLMITASLIHDICMLQLYRSRLTGCLEPRLANEVCSFRSHSPSVPLQANFLKRLRWITLECQGLRNTFKIQAL